MDESFIIRKSAISISSARSSFFGWYFIFYYSTEGFFGPLWNPLSILSFSLFNFFFLNNLFCCLNSEISILWYIINLIKLQILKHLQKRKMVLSFLLNVVILHVIFRCLWRQCQVLIYFCVLIVYLHIIEILSHLPFEWHFSYISQW